MEQYKAYVKDQDGNNQAVDLSLESYREAEDIGLSLPQFINRAHAANTNMELFGTPFEQMMASAGMFMSQDHEYGIRPPTIHQILEGELDISLNAITRPDGQDALSPSGRLLFPAVLLQMVESELREDNGTYAAAFRNLVATTISVSTPRYDQPVIDMTAPRGVKSGQIAQLAEPDRLISISLSERSKRMPTFSIGIEISDEAARASTLDLVGIALREQAMQERADRIDEDLEAMINGDEDAGMTALAGDLITAYDADISAAMTMTQKAWVKWLRAQWKKRRLDWVICDIDTYLAVEGRTGRPQFTTGLPTNDERLNSLPAIANPGIDDVTRFFVVEDAATVGGAGNMVGLDSRRAIRRVIYTGATYQAIQNFVLRRSQAMRLDWSERHERLGFDEAFQKTALATA